MEGYVGQTRCPRGRFDSMVGQTNYPGEVDVQISVSRLRSALSVRCGLALVCLVAPVLGVASSAETVQSCGDLVESKDMETISSPAQVPGVYLARINEGNAERISNLFATDAVHRGPEGQVTKGRAAIREFYAGTLGNGRRNLAVGRSVADGHRVAFELISLEQPCNDDDPALAVDVMDINDDNQIQLFTVFWRPRPQ